MTASSTTEQSPAGRAGAQLSVVGLYKSYDHHGVSLSVLRNVSLELGAGEMVAVVGSSGVGKSTFLQMLGALDAPSRGQILFDGRDISQLRGAALAAFRNRHIGFVFQFHHLLPEFSALENVMLPCLIGDLPRAEAKRRSAELLERVGLGSRLSHTPSEMSGGEQQRVAIARALVMRPSLVLADEPTGNLDRHTGEEIHQLFLSMNREFGSTVLVVTHNLELAAFMPRALRMGDGGVLEPWTSAPLPAATAVTSHTPAPHHQDGAA